MILLEEFTLIPNRLIDENGQIVTKDNVHGEVYVRGPQLMTSYVRNPSATADIISDGWLRTGDVCYVSEGKWFVVDRKKELIKVRGWQVAPAELEGVLVSHPKILDAAVVRVKFGDSEAPRAFILRAPGVKESDLNEEDVRVFMAEKLAKFKALKGGIVFVKAIPKNMTGKTVKKTLTKMHPYTET
jgi:acyl-CoA synthetase (AMP-forming)/AMP-acid ligase II